MTELLKSSLNIYSNYEMFQALLILLTIGAVAAIYIWRQSRDKKSLLLLDIAMGLALVTSLGVNYFAYSYFESINDGFQQISTIIVLILSILSAILHSVEYNSELEGKRFDVDHVNRRHFDSTLNLSVVVIAVTVSLGLFTNDHLGQAVISAGIPTVISLVLTHFAALRLFRDQ